MVIVVSCNRGDWGDYHSGQESRKVRGNHEQPLTESYGLFWEKEETHIDPGRASRAKAQVCLLVQYPTCLT